MTLRPRPTTLLAATAGLLLGACSGSLYDAAGVPRVDANGCDLLTQHVCPGETTCRDNTNPDYCGDACVVCEAAPVNGARACVGGADGSWSCGFTCTAPQLACGGQCVDESPSACGSTCQVCTAPAGAVPTCSPETHTCGFTCAPGLLPVGGECRAPVAVAAGAAHACALTEGGGLVCWGANDAGQLGAAGPGGTTPVTVFASGATSVAAGGRHTCAIRGGSVTCWGANGAGQLGTSGPGGSIPVILTLPGATQLAAGGSHTCAVAAAGRLWCWGANGAGQLGVGDLVAHPGVSASPFASGVTQVVAAADGTCAIVAGATTDLWCWGANEAGQTGKGVTSAAEMNPVKVPLPSAPLQAAVGTTHACAIAAPTGLWCWGENAEAQLGTGATGAPALTPVAAVGLDGGGGGEVGRSLVAVAGAAFTCTAKDQLEVKCAGRTDVGQTGLVSAAPALEGGPIAFGASWSQLSAGADFTCALVALAPAPGVMCWGGNASGQLGRPTAQAWDALAGLVGQ
jgi:alpha-tubulin suppressor-like RCC1 family protein